ncbi:MAG: methyltransferase [Chthoniobacterales bacterium]
MDFVFNRPEPLDFEAEVVPFAKRTLPQAAIDDLRAGRHVLIQDFYSSGLVLLSEIRRGVNHHYADRSYRGQRENRAAFRDLLSRILLHVKGNRLQVRKAPEIGWLSDLYPDVSDFLLSFPQVQGLNSSWQWYQKGISIPTLKEKLFPYYGTYFPTRFEHLQLFEDWLSDYTGSKETAIDVGVGCGVITYQLLEDGFEKVFATDINPNAIYGMQQSLKGKDLAARVELARGDLFATSDRQADLIVFNPPWLPLEEGKTGIEQAMYHAADLLPRFFAEAPKHLKPGGRLVLMFSNLAQITGQAKANPIDVEIKHGGRFVKDSFVNSKVGSASNKTRRNQSWRGDELVELWVLKPAL